MHNRLRCLQIYKKFPASVAGQLQSCSSWSLFRSVWLSAHFTRQKTNGVQLQSVKWMQVTPKCLLQLKFAFLYGSGTPWNSQVLRGGIAKKNWRKDLEGFFFVVGIVLSPHNFVSSLLSPSALVEAADCEEEDESACGGVTNTLWLFWVCKHVW